MPVIFLRDPYITHFDINECLDAFQLILTKQTPPELFIRAETRILDIDMLLVGYLMLFKEQQPSLEIILQLPFNEEKDPDDYLHYKLKQFGTYAYLMTDKSVFRVEFKESNINFNFTSTDRFPEGWFVLSEHFTLLLPVETNVEAYQFLFRRSIKHTSDSKELYHGLPGIDWNISSSELYASYNRTLIETATPDKTGEAIRNLGLVAFYKCVDNAKVLSIYLDPEYRKNRLRRNRLLRAGSLRSRADGDKIVYDAYNFFEEIEYVFNELSEQPLITQFLFATFTSQELLPDILEHDTREEFKRKFCGLWSFTKDLVRSLLELTRNIRQHVEGGGAKGVVTARVYTGAILQSLRNKQVNGGPLYAYRVENHDADANAFVDINVIDLGTEGIISTLLRKTKDDAAILDDGDPFKGLFLEDVNAIENGEVGLDNLLDVQQEYHLNQQMKRSIAHLGLLIFSKLITQNNGLIVATSPSGKGEQDLVILPGFPSKMYERLRYGTHFKVLLAIRPDEHYEPVLPQMQQIPFDSSVVQIRGLEKLLSYTLWDVETERITPVSEVTIVSCKLPEVIPESRSSEANLWKAAERPIRRALETMKAGEKRLVHFDFAKVSLDESQLFRFLGKWEISWPGENLIISNIPSILFHRLCEAKEAYFNKHQKKLLPFWNPQMAIVVYSWVADGEDYFYFADALWGVSNIDFLNVNKLIHRNHFNSVSLVTRHPYNETRRVEIINNPAFYGNNILLPFDLLLPGVNGMTLFESNAMMLLKNEIKPKFNA